MSFENKGFPNDLNYRYDEMNKFHSIYTRPENYGVTPSPVSSNIAPVGAVLPKIESAGQKHKRSGKGKEKLKKVGATLGGFLSELLKGDSSPDTSTMGATIGTEEKPTELPEYVVTSPKKKSNALKYVSIGIIALILIVIAYKMIKKK
jgi:hypothetical protein